jgi:predicted NUDIX family NTP pyrophosphohydrolase
MALRPGGLEVLPGGRVAAIHCAAMPKLSAGLLLYRITGDVVEVLIGHPGGPFWAKKDDGAWSVPKGEYTEGEAPWDVARREFHEEIGMTAPDGPRTEFPPVKQPSGKVVTVFAVQGDLDLTGSRSNTFELEWPKGSGNVREHPEIDRVGWFSVAAARSKLLKGQRSLLDRLMELPSLARFDEGSTR